MIIAVQGTHKENNNSQGAVAMLASLTSSRFQKKTLILQLGNPKDIPVENMLGKQFRPKQTFSSTYQFTDKGIDSLISKASVNDDKETVILTEEQFSKACITVLKDSNQVSVLDVAASTTIKDFEASLIQNRKSLEELLKNAEKYYECIYLLLPHNVPLLKELLPLVDINIICVPQAKKQPIEKLEGKKNYILVADYEFHSRHSLNSIKKSYEEKKIFAMPHTVDYKDALVDCELLNFIYSNSKNDEVDDNYIFIENLMKLIKEYIKEDEMESRFEDGVIMNFDETEIPGLEVDISNAIQKSPTPISVENFSVETQNAGLFKKKTETTVSFHE